MTADLTGFSWHTGGPVRALAEGEAPPALYRDLGPEAMLRLLRGRLPRLAGPTSPVTYLRTADYVEPYEDHEHFGRLVLLPWGAWRPWHSGVERVYVTDADARFDPACMDVLPDDGGIARVSAEARAMASLAELRELLGGRHHDAWKAELGRRLETFTEELADVERAMAPLRRAYQSSDDDLRRRARDRMAERSITERDLCSPWHHLSRERRAQVLDAIGRGGLWP